MCVALPSDLFDFITFKKYSFVVKEAGHKSYANKQWPVVYITRPDVYSSTVSQSVWVK